MASRKVTIRRRENTTKLPDIVYAESKRKIGSFFTQNGDVATGLSLPEIKKFMPLVLGMSETDVTFMREVREWYKNISINVPVEGVTLEVGLDEDTRDPLNLLDYIRYRFAIIAPDVASEEGGITSNSQFRFYIHDAKKEQDKNFQDLSVRKNAMKEFIKVSADARKVDMLLRLYGKSPKNMDTQQKELYLEEQIKIDPQLFTTRATDKELELKAFIEQCLSAQVLRRVGNAVLDGDEKLADTQEDAVVVLKDAKNSGILTTLKARLQQFE